MKTIATTPQYTRRSALALVLAGATLPAGKSQAAAGGTIDVYWHAISNGTPLTTCSGQSFTASFASEMLVGSGGVVKGYMRFAIGSAVIDYVAIRGGLDFDSAGQPIRAVVLLSRRGSSGTDARDFMLATVEPDSDPSGDCLIYTTIGTQVHAEPTHFRVRALWGVRKLRG